MWDMCAFDYSFFYQKHFVTVSNRLQLTLSVREIVLDTHEIFVGLLEAKKMTFVVGYNQGYRRMHANLHTPS